MNMGFNHFLVSLLAMTTMIALSSSSIVKYSNAFSFSSSSLMSSFSSTSSTYTRNSRAVTTSIFEYSNAAAALFASSSSNDDDNNDNNSDADDHDHDENIKNEEVEEEENKNEQNTEQEDAAERWKIQAKELREQIQKMEDTLPPRSPTRSTSSSLSSTTDEISEVEATINELSYNVIKKKNAAEPASILDGKRILLVGANGRLGSMVCRKLLRTYPEIKELVAMVHVVGENSGTSRGYGRLSYEVGAEDGRGTINPAWDLQDRNAYFEFDEEVMSDYNLDKLRVVECELLDPVQCTTIVEDSKADIVVWCASDFDGNVPRALSGGSGPLSSLPFLFRAIASPDKGRVEVEGLYNILGSLKTMRQEEIQRQRRLSAFDEKSEIEAANNIGNDNNVIDKPVDILLVSNCPDALGDFETPAGTFLDIKRQGEDMIPNDFPSLSYSVLQFATYEDNFVGEDLELKLLEVQNEKPRITTEQPSSSATNNIEQKEMNSSVDKNTSLSSSSQQTTTTKQKVRRINRRDAARAVTEAMIDPDFRGKKIQVWTNEK